METNKNQDNDDDKQEDQDNEDAEPGEGGTYNVRIRQLPPSVGLPSSDQDVFVGSIFLNQEVELAPVEPMPNITSYMLDRRSMEKLLDEEMESKVFLDGALKITRTSHKGQFSFHARIVSSWCEFNSVREFLQTRSMFMVGPLIDIELPSKSDTVPEGLKIALAHCLSALEPEDEIFRQNLALDGDEDQPKYHIVKVTSGQKMEIIESFSNFEGKFFETEKMGNKSLCYITTCFFGFFKRPVCDYCPHGAKVRLLVTRDTTLCPHMNSALKLTILCTGGAQEYQENLPTTEDVCIRFYGPDEDLQIDISSVYKVETSYSFDHCTAGSATFTFWELCAANGKLVLGNIPSRIQPKNCKKNFEVKFEILKKINDEHWDSKKTLYKDIPKCTHEQHCETGALCGEPSPVLGHPGPESSMVFKSRVGGNNSGAYVGNNASGSTFNFFRNPIYPDIRTLVLNDS